MASWAQLVAQLQTDLTDPSGVFHTDTAILEYLKEAELLFILRRALYERTQTLLLDSLTPLYLIHSVFPDFIRPLRVTVKGMPLRWDSFAAVGRLNSNWYRERGEVESVFMIGATILGFAPLPLETSAEITYLARPIINATVPTIETQYHPSLQKYAEAVSLAKEADYARAADALKEFLALANISRDNRFLEGFAQRSVSVTRQTERRAED